MTQQFQLPFTTSPFTLKKQSFDEIFENSRKSSIDFCEQTNTNTFTTFQQKQEDFSPNFEFQADQMISIENDADFNQNSQSPDHISFGNEDFIQQQLIEEKWNSPQNADMNFSNNFIESGKPYSIFTLDAITPGQQQQQQPSMKQNNVQQDLQPEYDFLDFSDEDSNKNKKIQTLTKQPFSIIQKSIKKQKSKKQLPRKNYDKNICRYLTRKTIRCFSKLEYQEQVLKYTKNDFELYYNATEYFVRRIEQITGFRVLKEFLDTASETDPEVRSYKMVFKQFYKWFLKERIARYILNGEMDDKKMYIQYKNEVMLKYTDSLNDWTSNKQSKKRGQKTE